MKEPEKVWAPKQNDPPMGDNRRVFWTRNKNGTRTAWVEVTGMEWDKLSDSQRQILRLRDEIGSIVYVQRVSAKLEGE